jgi:hypothetical protein
VREKGKERERERTYQGGCRRRHKDDDEEEEEEEKEEEEQKTIEAHSWLRGPRRGGFSHRLETPTPTPTST